MTTATITQKSIQIGKEPVVILPLKEYQKLCERAVPTYHLKGKAAKELDSLVKEGLRDYYAGKCIDAPSMKEALKIYAKKNKRS